MPRSLLTALALLTLVVLPSPAHAAKGMEMALQDDDVFLWESVLDLDEALEHAVELRTKRIRVNVLWSRVMVEGADRRTVPEDGPRYDFHRIDRLQAAAAERGIKLQLTITGPAPAWATRDHRVGNNAPDARKFGEFARTVATHFAGRVDRYSIWNEPNWNTWLFPAKHAASLYRKLYVSGYKAVKAVDPRAKVLFGELAPIGGGRAIAPLKFLRDVTCSNATYKPAHPRKRCAPLKADGFAIHPYQFQHAPNRPAGKPDDVPIGALSRLTSALDKLAKRRALTTPSRRKMQLYLTEFGYLTQGKRAQKPKVRAKWLHDAFHVARRHPRVRQLLQYQLVDPPREQLWHTAILDRRGRPLATYAGLAKASAANR
jgi:hypothetical protein